MKMKYLVMVSLILAVLTIGAASASEDIAIDDELAVSDEGVDIEEAPADESTLGGESYVEDFETYYDEVVPVNAEKGIISVEDDGGNQGNITIAVDDKPVCNKEFNGHSRFYLDDLNITATGEYKVLVNFIPETGSKLTLANYKLIVTEKEANIGISADIYSGVDLTDSWETVVYYDNNNDNLEGNILVYIGGEIYYNAPISSFEDIAIGDLSKKAPVGTYLVQVKYKDGENLTLIKSAFTSFYYDIAIDDFEYGDEILPVGSEYMLDVSLPADAKGALVVIVNGKEYNAVYKGGHGNVTIQTLNMDVGKEYVFKIVLRNDPNYSESPVSYNVTTVPGFDYPFGMSVGEKETLSVELPSKYAGTLSLYKAKWDNGVGEYVKDGNAIGTANVVNGKASISLSGLTEGMHELLAEYVSGSYSYSTHFDVDVIKNSGNVSASVEPTTIDVGNSVTIKLTGPKDLNEEYSVYIDGERQNKVLNPFKTGSDSMTYKFTTAGEHKIKVIGYGEFYSNTFYVTVKAKQTPVVKKATKITAKKATFKAKKKVKKYTITLKAGKAAVKKVKVTLKVAKKTYKAFTNNKGKATFKITKLTKKGKYNAVIKFAGDKNYKASKKTVKIIVKK